MNTPKERLIEEPDFKNVSSQIYPDLDAVPSHRVDSKTLSVRSDRDKIDQKQGVVQKDCVKFDSVFETSLKDEYTKEQMQNNSVNFDDIPVTLEQENVAETEFVEQKDGENVSVLLGRGKSDQYQSVLKVNDNVPIAQMFQKEKNTSDNLLIKDIWSQKKMVYFNQVFKTNNDKKNTTGHETQNRQPEVIEQEHYLQNTENFNSKPETNPHSMKSITCDIAQNVCQDKKMTSKTFDGSEGFGPQVRDYSDQIQLESGGCVDNDSSDNGNLKVFQNGNFKMSLNTKYLHAIDKCPGNVSSEDSTISSTEKPRLNVDHEINDIKTNMIGSDGNHVFGHHDNRAEKNQNHTDWSTHGINDSKVKSIGHDNGIYNNRSGKNHSDWSADNHMMMHSHSKSKLPTRTKRQKRTKYCRNWRSQVEIKMEEYARTNGFTMVDVARDGNCMFTSVVDQLRTCGILKYTTRKLRSTVVKYLKKNPRQEDGTHTEMFLNYETWEEYLYRMEQDAEWGDHIILSTIAKILNRCISVVNVSLTNQTATLIQPSLTNLDQSDLKRTLFLGHFGEEHFVSLRPVDWENTWYIYGIKENVQTSSLEQEQECVVTVEDIPTYIKQPTSIDDVSDTPLPHFSFLLKYLLKSMYLVHKQSKSRFTKPINGDQSSGELAGSRTEGINFELSDISPRNYGKQINCCKCHRNCHKEGLSYDLMIHMENNMVVCDSDKSEISMKCLVPDSRDVPPGYTKLRLLNPDEWDKKDIYLSEENVPYLKHLLVVFGSPCSNINPEVILKRLKKGINYPSWPNEAMEWVNRKRHNWPSINLVSKIVENGCIVVSRSHPDFDNPDIVWQFLFSRGEQILIKEGLTQEQLRCFSIFKVLFDCHVRILTRKLSTSLLKHVMFYCCEIVPSSYWSENQSGCLLFLFDRLLENLRHHNLPNYFIRENNMISHYPREIIQELGDKVEAIRKFPILSLIFVCERHGLLDDSEFEKVLDDVEVYKSTRNLYLSVTEVFIPVMVDLDNPNLCCDSDHSLVYILQDAYEMVLSASSTQGNIDTPNFQDFVLDLLKQDADDFDWLLQKCFIALTLDRHLKTSIMSSLMSSTDSIRLKEIVGEENKGMYGDLLVPKSKHDCVDFIIKFTTILYELRFYEEASFYLRYGIQRVKDEKSGIAMDDSALKLNDFAPQLSNTESDLRAEEIRETASSLKMFKLKICNNNFVILFYMLHNCYTLMNQIECIQEFVDDFEAIAVETRNVSALQLLSEIYASLGSDQRSKAINQKVISLRGSIP